MAAVMTTMAASGWDDEAARLRRRDPEALTALVARFQHRLYRYLLRFVHDRAAAEDLFQQTWLKVMERIRTYNPDRSFEAWLFSVAHNAAIDHLRRKRPESLDDPLPSGGGREETLSAERSDALERYLALERSAILASVIAELPAIHREVLALRFEEDLKLEEIAVVIDAPLSTAKSRLKRAIEGLRLKLERRLHEGDVL